MSDAGKLADAARNEWRQRSNVELPVRGALKLLPGADKSRFGPQNPPETPAKRKGSGGDFLVT